ncbi:DUF692 family multinuclear iron-containing protein [Streptomyces sp. NPDC047000]|uniref:DUF692 domain-containing protein n=1 Tax=Streptomyces sp. NPDC047000 TaxID=3155474 RepID=UPI0033FFE804
MAVTAGETRGPATAGGPVRLGTGIGWRPEIADAVEEMPGIDWVEVVAENVCPGHLPESLLRLRARGVTVVPHGVSLGLGGAEPPGERRLTALAERAQALGSPLVTEHIAFVRAGGPLTASPALEAGHLLPVPRTRDALDVLCENVRIAQDALPVPLAVENIAALIAWPGEELTEGQFLYELADRTGVRLLVDVANLHTNHVNRGEDPAEALAELPLEALAYVHVAGGVERDGVWHDSHAHPVPEPVLAILTDLASRTAPPGVLLERDDDFPAPAELERELTAIHRAVVKGRARTRPPTPSPAAPPPTPPTPTTAQAPTPAPEPLSTPASTPIPSSTPAPASTTAPEPSSTTTPGSAPTPEPSSLPGTRSVSVPTPRSVSVPTPRSVVVPASASVHACARQRLALAQTALLSALVAGTPAPEGFDRARLRVQSRALTAKRADVVAKVAPELPGILGTDYRPAFLAYAHDRPMTGGHRRDALDFAEHLLTGGTLEPGTVRRELRQWWRERSGPVPPTARRTARLAGRARRLLLRP